MPRWVIEQFSKQGNGDDWSITCFFMALFDRLLFLTNSFSINGDIYFWCKNINDVCKFDLSSAIDDDLANKVHKWKKSSASNSPSVQGCVALLLVWLFSFFFVTNAKQIHQYFNIFSSSVLQWFWKFTSFRSPVVH